MNYKENLIEHQFRNPYESAIDIVNINSSVIKYGTSYIFNPTTGYLSVDINENEEEGIIYDYPDRMIRFYVTDNLDLIVMIPDNYDDKYNISINNGYLRINRT